MADKISRVGSRKYFILSSAVFTSWSEKCSEFPQHFWGDCPRACGFLPGDADLVSCLEVSRLCSVRAPLPGNPPHPACLPIHFHGWLETKESQAQHPLLSKEPEVANLSFGFPTQLIYFHKAYFSAAWLPLFHESRSAYHRN